MNKIVYETSISVAQVAEDYVYSVPSPITGVAFQEPPWDVKNCEVVAR